MRDGPKRIVRLGIAGLGQAAAAMLPEILAHPRVQLVAAADVRPEARAQFERELEGRSYAEVAQLCADPQVDAVYVATPHQYHAPHAILAAEHGKHVLLEKPMALNLADCDAMIEAAERHGVSLLVGRGSHGFDPPILKIREIVRSGDLGRLGMIHTWHYGDFLYRPRTPAELDTSQGGGVLFNQGPHQIDIVRVIGGGMLRSVRAMTGNWDPARSTEGAFSCYLEFTDGAGATIVYSGYDHFDTDEYHDWIGTYGGAKRPDHHGATRRALRDLTASGEAEAAIKASFGYGGTRRREERPTAAPAPTRHVHWGETIASCERGDLRPSLSGVEVFDDTGRHEIAVPLPIGSGGGVLDELTGAIFGDQLLHRDGRWEKATLEVCLAILESARDRREVYLQHQVPTRD
jgi:phthalate 4,5-cis-dihydrodiol dehydrogenase